jgi:lactoylglutathione lyase
VPTSLDYTFNHIHVFCSDLETSERWFVDGMGAASVLKLGGAQILLRGKREGEELAPAGSRHFGTDHFGLEVPDVDGTVAELRRRGVTIEVEPWDFRRDLRIAFVKGPDNVRIELVEPRPSS